MDGKFSRKLGSRKALSKVQAVVIIAIVLVVIISAIYYYITLPAPTPFSIQVIPEHVVPAVAGQRCIFLVVVDDEEQIIGNGKVVSISVTPPNFGVTVNPQAITSEQVAEVTVVIPDEASVGENLTVTIHGERGGLKQTKTVTVEVWEFRWPIEEIEEMTEGGMRSVCDRFVPWLATNQPELCITGETEWTGILIKPLMPVEMFYTFFSEEWEMGVSKHVMIPPDDWAKIYLRRRFTEASPSYAFKISSLEAKEEPHVIDPPQSVWR